MRYPDPKIQRRTDGLFLNLAFVSIPLVAMLSVFSAPLQAADNANASASEKRIAEWLKYLSSDELGGRGVGTDGIDRAADYLAKEFSEMGLNTKRFKGTPFQPFTITVGSELGKDKNHLSLVGPPKEPGGKPVRIELKLGENFNTLAIGGSGSFDLPIVFGGYGITAKKEGYDDYAGFDLKGKAVLIIRKEPQQDDSKSVFNGKRPSQHAYFTRKVSNAFDHGAGAVIILNDHHSIRQLARTQEKAWEDAVDKMTKIRAEFKEKENPTPIDIAKHRGEITSLAKRVQELNEKLQSETDQVVPFLGAGQGERREMPVFFVSRKSVEPILVSAFGDKKLTTIESEIDKELKPQSVALMGWRAVGEAHVIHRKAEVKNVVAVLEGEGDLADETVVVGAHYDHLGMGGAGSLAPWTKEIHNGADDNGSGTAALIEVARRFATANTKPRRRLVFIAFTAEERGLLGSAKYVREPRFPLENTVAMVNMDMVGRLKDDKLTVYGTGTADGFDALIEQLNEKYKFKITKKPTGFGPSDHSSFYAKKIPVFHVFTGTHSDYHRPSDDFEKINVEGMGRIAGFVGDIVESIANAQKRPVYRETKRGQAGNRGGNRPFLGGLQDLTFEGEGFALMGVTNDGPADRAGLKSGDVIVKFGDSKIGSYEDLEAALKKQKPNDKVKVGYLREEKELTATVTLGKAP